MEILPLKDFKWGSGFWFIKLNFLGKAKEIAKKIFMEKYRNSII